MTTKRMPVGAGHTHGHRNVDNRQRAGGSIRPAQDSTPQPGRQVLYNSRGQRCASIVGDLLCKSVHGSTHRIRHPFAAWALDLAHVEAARAAGVKRIEIHDLDDDATYTILLADFLAAAQPVDFPQYGPQLKVGVGRWHCARPPMPGEPVQLSLL